MEVIDKMDMDSLGKDLFISFFVYQGPGTEQWSCCCFTSGLLDHEYSSTIDQYEVPDLGMHLCDCLREE